MRCPHCGKMIFQQTAPVIEYQDGPGPGVFTEAINFAVEFGVVTTGSYLFIWQADWQTYWLAPAAGLASAVGITMLKAWWSRDSTGEPEPEKRVRLVVDVKETDRPRQTRTVLDVFRDCRPSQLRRFADGYINQSIDPSRRKMGQIGVTEGQFSRIQQSLLDGGWADKSGDYINAPVEINWRGRAILRAVLADIPPPPPPT